MKKSVKEHGLAKVLLVNLLLVVVLTWIIPTGSYGTGAEFTEGTLQRIGLIHIFYGLTYAVQNFSIQIIYLIFVGIFYGVVSKTDGYKNLVSKIAKFGKGKEIGFAVVISLIIALLTSMLTYSFAVVMFIPFLIHVLRKMNFSKLSAFISTFGAMFVGMVGATFGTDGGVALVTYLTYGGSDVTLTTELLMKFGILLLTFIVYSFFNIRYLKKSLNNKEEKENDDELLLEDASNKKARMWPFIVIMIVLLVFAILGFVDWSNNFDLEIFEDFHEWFMDIAIGKFKIFDAIIGTQLDSMSYQLTGAFGTWYLFTYSIIIAIVTLVASLISRVKVNEFIENAYDGIKKMIRPICLIILSYMVFVILYWAPIMPTIINALGKLSGSFNIFVTSLQAIVGSIFNSDLGFLSYNLSYLLGSFADKEANIVYLIYLTMYGLVSFVTPISMFLIFGLSYLNIPYKKWLSYIWKFVVAMLVILLIIFTLLTFI